MSDGVKAGLIATWTAAARQPVTPCTTATIAGALLVEAGGDPSLAMAKLYDVKKYLELAAGEEAQPATAKARRKVG